MPPAAFEQDKHTQLMLCSCSKLSHRFFNFSTFSLARKTCSFDNNFALY